MEIRPARHADLPSLIDLLGVLFRQEADFEPDEACQEAGLRMVLDQPETGQVLVVRAGEDIVGMVSLLFVPSTALGKRVAVLEDFVVRPEHRNCGYGRALFEAALERARSRGCGRVSLLTDGDNSAAQRFYRRQGFTTSAMVTMRRPL